MFKNMKIKLEKEYEELCEYSDECHRKSKILENNTVDSKFKKIKLQLFFYCSCFWCCL